jgi:hypothetical protein
MNEEATSSNWQWVQGTVDQAASHLRLIHHGGTSANLYSDVEWNYWPEGYSPSSE